MTSKLVIMMVVIYGLVCRFDYAVVVNGSSDDDYVINEDCEDLEIKCACDNSDDPEFITLTQKRFAVETELGITECKSPFDPFLLCENNPCAAKEKYAKLTGSNSLKMKRNIVESFYPQEITISPSTGNMANPRFARATEPCALPTLKNAEIKCWKWPNWMDCNVTCIHGHALQEQRESVKRVNLNCRSTENVWKPHGFEDCQPYVNCKAHLVKPGNLKCKEPIDGPAYCEISCLDYDEFEATSLKKYECLDETFPQILPHCATVKDVPLIKKPN